MLLINPLLFNIFLNIFYKKIKKLSKNILIYIFYFKKMKINKCLIRDN